MPIVYILITVIILSLCVAGACLTLKEFPPSEKGGNEAVEKPDPLKDYLESRGWLNEYDLFKPMLKDNQLSETEKQLIEYFNSLPSKYQNNSKILNSLKNIISDGEVSEEELKTFKDWDKDTLNNLDEINKYHTDPLKPNPNTVYAIKHGLEKYIDLVKPLDSDGTMQDTEKTWINILIEYREILTIPTLFNYLKEESKDGEITENELVKADNFTSLVKEIHDIIMDEERAWNKLNDTDHAAKLALKLGFDTENATEATIKAIAEYAIAVKDLQLPEQLEALQTLIQGTQDKIYGEKLVDFSPIIFHSVDENDFIISPNAPRETWLLARHIKTLEENGYNILSHPEMFEALNIQVIANAWEIFDAPFGIGYLEKKLNNRIVKPTDADVEQLLFLQWQLYTEASKGKYYNRDFPWHDSDALDKLYTDKNTRRIALFYLFCLPNAVWDLEKQEKVYGMKGAETALKQAFSEYQKISELYPDGRIGEWNEDPRVFYYWWLIDRGHHGLWETVKEFVGIEPDKLLEIARNHPNEVWEYIKDYNGIDQYLTKNWQYWDLVKFIVGYWRWNPKGGIEEYREYYLIPQTLRMFGFPATDINNIEPHPPGTTVSEWAISLPDHIAASLSENFDVIIAPGNNFGLYETRGGLVKDGIKIIYLMIRGSDKVIYLLKESEYLLKQLTPMRKQMDMHVNGVHGWQTFVDEARFIFICQRFSIIEADTSSRVFEVTS